MSRLCAKPTCADDAVRWLDVIAAEQHVVERSAPTPSTLALCESHAERFSVPDGWVWVGLQPAADPPLPQAQESPEIPETADSEEPDGHVEVRRQHSRDAPWFLSNSSSEDETPDSPPGAPTGSLLHRAFNGPDRAADAARSRQVDREETGRREPRTSRETLEGGDDDDVATVRDIGSRRQSRTSVTSYDVELPFPPLDAEPHVAVS